MHFLRFNTVQVYSSNIIVINDLWLMNWQEKPGIDWIWVVGCTMGNKLGYRNVKKIIGYILESLSSFFTSGWVSSFFNYKKKVNAHRMSELWEIN